ncbi:MAG: hypothetical protein U0470_04305 [Anaerolineae bacterium]
MAPRSASCWPTWRGTPTASPRRSASLNSALRLERIGDHATNIGERVVFLATGEHVELNS